MTIKGNVGEWSEIYTLFKVIGDKALHAGDESLEKISDVVYPVIKVLRVESNGTFEYCIEDELVFITNQNKLILKIQVSEFARQARKLFNEILVNKSIKHNTTFELPGIEDFMEKIHCSSLKASSSQKTDITIKIHDNRTNQQPVLGFSIKSQLGNPSTLLNAGKNTNFLYSVNELSEIQKEEINNITVRRKVIARVKRIKELGGVLNFVGIEEGKQTGRNFFNNLKLIDSLLPEILSEMIISFYTTRNSTIKELVEDIENRNPFNFDNSTKHKFYTYKIKKMLVEMALGMKPSEVWSGQYEATGGYLIVRDDGEVLCYHIYNRNDFEDYLFLNTKFETASSSPNKHNFAIFDKNKDMLFKLNLQIRFIK